jgi:hypothetical protein
MFTAHTRRMDALRAERLLDAAQAATAHYAGREWWDSTLAAARGVVAEVVRRTGPLFTWNGQGVNSSNGLRQRFAQHVTGSRVDA